MEHHSLQYTVTLALLSAILVILGFTPIGSIPLPVVKATTTHIPVIIGSILLGLKAGVFLGTLFGAVSVIRSTLMPTLMSFAFSPFITLPGSTSGSWNALVVAFVPRILVGLVAFALFRFLQRRGTSPRLSYALCAAAGSITNTVLVMGLIGILFGQAYGAALGVTGDGLFLALLTVTLTNGIGEAIVAVFAVTAVCSAVSHQKRRST